MFLLRHNKERVMSDNAINFNSPYYEKGFWFEPKRVEPEEADIWGNRKFLKKYWGEGDSSSINLSGSSQYSFDNYYTGNYGEYAQDFANNATSYNDVMNGFKDKLNNSDDTDSSADKFALDAYFSANYGGYEQKAAQDGFSYDNVFNAFREKLNNSGEQGSSSSSAIPNYYGYFDAYFN